MLYLRYSFKRLALKLFRGEPAISGFDWNFSPIHTSSPPFSTDVCSDLHCLLRQLHPGHGEITRFRACPIRLNALLRLGFPPAPHLKCLTSPDVAARRTVLQKVRGRTLTSSHSLQTQGFRCSFTPLPGSFSPFLHSTMRYRSLSSI